MTRSDAHGRRVGTTPQATRRPRPTWWVAACAAMLACSGGDAREIVPTAGGAGGAVDTAAPALIADDSLARAVFEYGDRLGRVGFSGVIVVERAGRILHARGEGLADREAGRPFTMATVWSMGSITKPFTATAILRLIEQGRLSLSDSLGRYVDDLPADRAGITIEHLLTHHAGLAEANEGDFTPVDRDRIEEIARDTDLRFEPGSRYAYSNLGYSLLGVVIEKVTGESYESYLRRELLIPAGLYETGYVAPRWDASRLAVGYERGDRFGTLIERMPADGPYWVLRANGGLHTTAYDMLRWVRASLRGEVFGPTVAAWLTERRIERFPGSSVALGWAVDETLSGATSVHHDGSNGIFWADVRFFPAQDLVIIVASNVAELTAQAVATTIERLAFGEPVTLPPRIDRVTLAAEDRSSLTGSWRFGDEGRADVRWSGEFLELAVEGQDLIDRFLALEDGDAVRFRDMNRRADAALAAEAAGDSAGIAGALGMQEPPRGLTGLIASLRGDMGRFRDYEVLGTAPVWYASPYATWVRLTFEDGATIRRLHWTEDGSYYGLGGQVYRAPLILPCIGSGERECTGLHLVLPVRPPTLAAVAGGVELEVGGETLTGRSDRD